MNTKQYNSTVRKLCNMYEVYWTEDKGYCNRIDHSLGVFTKKKEALEAAMKAAYENNRDYTISWVRSDYIRILPGHKYKGVGDPWTQFEMMKGQYTPNKAAKGE
jgi:hypothetical protein